MDTKNKRKHQILNLFYRKYSVTQIITNVHDYDLPFINTTTIEPIEYMLHCNELVLLIIEKMNIAIFISSYIANKFPFIKRCIDNKDRYKKKNFYISHKCNIIVIDKEWDVDSWNIYKIKSIYRWIRHFEEFSTYEQVIDINFCKAMGIEM